MKAIIVMYDSLIKKLLSAYGCEWTITPIFQRLAEHSVKFDNCYVGSLPCMPARREMHTGRYNFLTRSWGPLEPFDISLPQELQKYGVYTHLATDHYHYWEDGGATYHNRFNSYDLIRGQEGDKWYGQIEDPEIPDPIISRKSFRWRQDWVNRQFLDSDEKMPQSMTFKCGVDFIERNKDKDSWMLQIESFDPHEPYYSQQKYKDLYPHEYNGRFFDWPPYREITDETPEEIKHIRYQYAALLSKCDESLGMILDIMDRYDMWKDTMLIVNTDHGFMLGEHNWLGKNVGPTFNEIANIPLFIWDPRYGKKNETRNALVQTIDIVPTLYNFFNVPVPSPVLGKDLSPVIQSDLTIRETALYGSHGGNLNCRCGKYVYMLAPLPHNDEIYNYTLDCYHMVRPFSAKELEDSELVGPFSYTNGYKILKVRKIKPQNQSSQLNLGSFLYDLEADPEMNHPINDPDPELIKFMKSRMVEVMKENEIPSEVYVRFGLNEKGEQQV